MKVRRFLWMSVQVMTGRARHVPSPAILYKADFGILDFNMPTIYTLFILELELAL